MSEPPGSKAELAAASTWESEKSATSGQPPISSSSQKVPKSRSCIVCRTRKVRCDKHSPCSNCRRANIDCVFPSTNRPPRWARRLEPLASNAVTDPGVARVMDRVHELENLVRELSGQLAQARANTGSISGASTDAGSPWSAQGHAAEHQGEPLQINNTGAMQQQFGRLVIKDPSRSRYVSSGFWSRVNDEIDGLDMDKSNLQGYQSDSSDDASVGTSPYTQESDRTPLERNSFLFRHDLKSAAHDHTNFHPLPSQIPFLLDVFSENVNIFMQIVHIPTITKMVRDLRSNGMSTLTPANEALLLSIYYAAISSMEEEDVQANFGASKLNLSLKYRVGLEHALAKADFLNAPDIVLVQAFAIFLSLVRRHDSPRYVWMITGLLVRMAFYLGLQRDGTHFDHLTPFEIETRRKVWWSVYMLDLRASEDQGTDLTIASGSFDTKIPLNINDADISPKTKETPKEREGITDMSFARIQIGLCNIMIQMMSSGLKGGIANLEEQNHLLEEIYQTFERGYLQYMKGSEDISCWVGITITRLVRAKMTLILFLPVLFSSPSDHFSAEMRTKLLVSAIEVAECNHALNSEQACRKWRWVFQTYTHWYAIVYMMIEIARRPWSPVVERAWVALHSRWLIPAQNSKNKNMRVWFPLRKLMAKDRKHRRAELTRLRAAPQEAAKLELEDPTVPDLTNYRSSSAELDTDAFRERWRRLVALPAGPQADLHSAPNAEYIPDSGAWSMPTHSSSSSNFSLGHESIVPTVYGQQNEQTLRNSNMNYTNQSSSTTVPTSNQSDQIFALSYNPPADFQDDVMAGSDFIPWLMTDTADISSDIQLDMENMPTDMDLDLGSDMDWHGWIEAAKGMEMDMGMSGIASWQDDGFGTSGLSGAI